MSHIEVKKALPKDLIVPPLRTKGSLDRERELKAPPDFANKGCYIGRLVSLGYIALEGGGNLQVIRTPKDLFSIIEKHRHTFVIMPLNYISILWKGFSDNFKEHITRDPSLWSTEGSWAIMRPSPRKYLFRQGSSWYTLWILQINKTVEDPELLVHQYFRMDQLGLTPNPAGLPATGRDFLFGPEGPGSYNRIREEFSLTRKLVETNVPILEAIYSACKRPIMACGDLGLTSPAWNKDMKKAFLSALIHAPTMSPYLTVPDESPIFDPEATHGVYLIEVSIPPVWRFSPNLFRLEDEIGDYGVFSPTGGVQTQLVGQLRLKLYAQQTIPFKVLWAFKLLPTGGIEYPWALRGGSLALIVDKLKKQLPNLEGGLIYQAAIGSLLTNYECHDKNGDNKYRALNVFNPLLQLFIYEWVFINNWLEMLKNPRQTQLALRIDACSILDHKDFKSDDSSLYRVDYFHPTQMFFANPRQKDKNIKAERAVYKDAVEEAARKGEKEVYLRTATVGTLEMLLEGIISPENYGKRVTIKKKLNLGGETREPLKKEYKDQILPGDLIDNQIELIDPHLR